MTASPRTGNFSGIVVRAVRHRRDEVRRADAVQTRAGEARFRRKDARQENPAERVLGRRAVVEVAVREELVGVLEEPRAVHAVLGVRLLDRRRIAGGREQVLVDRLNPLVRADEAVGADRLIKCQRRRRVAERAEPFVDRLVDLREKERGGEHVAERALFARVVENPAQRRGRLRRETQLLGLRRGLTVVVVVLHREEPQVAEREQRRVVQVAFRVERPVEDVARREDRRRLPRVNILRAAAEPVGVADAALRERDLFRGEVPLVAL